MLHGYYMLQKEDETVTEPPTPFITPYPPGIMLKRNKKAIVHGDVHLKVCSTVCAVNEYWN